MADQHVPSWQAATPPVPQPPSGLPGEGAYAGAGGWGQPGQYGAAQFGQSAQYGQPGQYGQPDQYGQSAQYGQPGQFGQPGQPGQYAAAPYGAPAPQAQAANGLNAYNQLPYAQSGVADSEPQQSPGIGVIAFVAGCVAMLLLLFMPWLATVIIGMVLGLVALGLGASSMRKKGLLGRFSLIAFCLGVTSVLIGTVTIIVMISLS